MRISDWSSDVCSSDLDRSFRYGVHRAPVGRELERHQRPQRRDLGPAHVRVLPQQREPEDGGPPHEPTRHRNLNATRTRTTVLKVAPGEERIRTSEQATVSRMAQRVLPMASPSTQHTEQVESWH